MKANKNKIIPVSMPEHMKEDITSAAAERNMSKSAYIRSAVLDAREYNLNRPAVNAVIVNLIEWSNGLNNEENKVHIQEAILSLSNLLKGECK